MTSRELQECADAMHSVLRCLYHHLHDPDYNFAIVAGPTQQQDSPYLHWFVRVQPRLVTHGGFELGTGVAVNPSLPEQDAFELRETLLRMDSAPLPTSVPAR
jgi:UDPglucose--hexose-1-phosphate uridylyltransferase